jgi:hypothetical protein
MVLLLADALGFGGDDLGHRGRRSGRRPTGNRPVASRAYGAAHESARWSAPSRASPPPSRIGHRPDPLRDNGRHVRGPPVRPGPRENPVHQVGYPVPEGPGLPHPQVVDPLTVQADRGQAGQELGRPVECPLKQRDLGRGARAADWSAVRVSIRAALNLVKLVTVATSADSSASRSTGGGGCDRRFRAAARQHRANRGLKNHENGIQGTRAKLLPHGVHAAQRRRTGIEPASAAARRSPVLKTGGPTRYPDASASTLLRTARGYGVRRCRSRGNSVTSRIFSAWVSLPAQRSRPIANPPCGGIPCAKASR